MDVKQLIKEIAYSIRKLSKDGFVTVSFAHCNSQYEKPLLPVFGGCIEITENAKNSGVLQMTVHGCNSKRRDLSGSRTLRLNKKELLLAPPK